MKNGRLALSVSILMSLAVALSVAGCAADKENYNPAPGHIVEVTSPDKTPEANEDVNPPEEPAATERGDGVTTPEGDEKFPYKEVDIGSDFTDNQIILTLTRTATVNNLFHDYDISDFPEIEVLSLSELSSSGVKTARKIKSGECDKSDYPYFNYDGFKRIILLNLKERGKQNVIDCIKKLYERDDIVSASPNYIYTLC